MVFKSAKNKVDALFNIVSQDDQVLILIFPDPDAISSAWTLKRLLWRKVRKVTIASIRETERLDNITMIQLLKIPIKLLSRLDINMYNRFALVDSQPHHFSALSGIFFDIIIDHHPFKEKTSGSFVDIAPEYGATATLLTEYLRAAKIRPSLRLATALFYGIKTDTQNFVLHGTEKDIKAFRYLFKYISQTIIRKIETSELGFELLPYFKKAFDIMQPNLAQHQLTVYLGRVKNPDVCVILADFFLRINEISWSTVAGLYGDKLIIIFRNANYRKHAGRLAEMAFGSHGQAGGHKEMARVEIPVANLKSTIDSLTNKHLKAYISNQIRKV
jgi:nanoRNase/pAp phosphatase (c-di-AMP/oligoRNAs hydrolase)